MQIYLDYAATTPVDARVAKKMQACLTQEGVFGNPSSMHSYGQTAKEQVEQARLQIAKFIHADPTEIIWTSGATESNNLAIKGAAQLYQGKGKHIITLTTEHKSVLDACQHLEKEGYWITYLRPASNGLLDANELIAALRDDTILVSVMHVNNETGVIQDIDAIAEITRKRGILLHVDAAQSAGKITLDMSKTAVDLLSLCAHKVYGPKGIGALYLRKKPRVRVQALIHGGGHEQGMRSGTLATHQIVGMGEAFRLANEEMESDIKHITYLRDHFMHGLSKIQHHTVNIKLNTTIEHCVPHILNISFENMIANEMLTQLKQIAASTASACQGNDPGGSHVLKAMGLSEEQSRSSIRFSFGRNTTVQDIDHTVAMIKAYFS